MRGDNGGSERDDRAPEKLKLKPKQSKCIKYSNTIMSRKK